MATNDKEKKAILDYVMKAHIHRPPMVEDIQNLISEGADINCKNEYESTPLMMSIHRRETDVALCLIQAGADLDIPSRNSQTPLMEAVTSNNIKIIECLATNGADIDKCDDRGWTALTLSVKSGNINLVKTITDASQNSLNKKTNDGNSWFSDCTPLMIAVKARFIDIAKFLIDIGADINIKDNSNKTVLDYCKYYKCKEIENYINFSKQMDILTSTKDVGNTFSF